MACGYNIGQHIFYSTQLKFESVTLKNNRKKKKKRESNTFENKESFGQKRTDTIN